MPAGTPSAVMRYAVAVVATAVALLLRFWMDPLLGDKAPYATFVMAVAVVVWHGGAGPALLAAALGWLLALYFFVPPRFTLAIGPEHVAGSTLYLPVALTVVAFGHALWLAQRRAAAAAAELERQSEKLQVTLSSIGDAVISTDARGQVRLLNPAAEALTGWPRAEAAGRPLGEVFVIVDEHTRRPAP